MIVHFKRLFFLYVYSSHCFRQQQKHRNLLHTCMVTCTCMYQRPTLSTFFSSPNQTLLRHQHTWCQTPHQSYLLFVSFGKKSEKNVQTYCFFTRQDLQHVFNGRLYGLIPLFHQQIQVKFPYFPDFIMRSGCFPLYLLWGLLYLR